MIDRYMAVGYNTLQMIIIGYESSLKLSAIIDVRYEKQIGTS
jgi:hypothetical protein